MTLQFPNLSRSFDATRGCVRFSGYDHTKEIAFFIEQDALRNVDGGSLADPESLLAAFDHNRDATCRAAVRAYGQRREGSYTLTLADF